MHGEGSLSPTAIYTALERDKEKDGNFSSNFATRDSKDKVEIHNSLSKDKDSSSNWNSSNGGGAINSISMTSNGFMSSREDLPSGKTIRTGWLKIRGSLNVWWNRWVVLRPGKLIYYRTEKVTERLSGCYYHLPYLVLILIIISTFTTRRKTIALALYC